MSILFLTSLVAACLPTYAQVGVMASILLIIVRLIQGAAFTNQFGLSCHYVDESLTRKRLAINLSWVCASGVVGSFVCGLLNTLLNHMFTPEDMMVYVWRIPFIVSGMMGLFGYFLIKRLDETKSYLRHQKHPDLNSSQSLSIGFSRTRSIIITVFYVCFELIQLIKPDKLEPLKQDISHKFLNYIDENRQKG